MTLLPPLGLERNRGKKWTTNFRPRAARRRDVIRLARLGYRAASLNKLTWGLQQGAAGDCGERREPPLRRVLVGGRGRGEARGCRAPLPAGDPGWESRYYIPEFCSLIEQLLTRCQWTPRRVLQEIACDPRLVNNPRFFAELPWKSLCGWESNSRILRFNCL